MANPARAQKQDDASIGFNLGAIALVLSMAGIGLAYVIDGAGHSDQRASGELEVTFNRTLSGKDLQIPQSWFRHTEHSVEGFVTRIDLELTLPIGAGERPARIEVTLLPRSRARPSASLLDGVYLHQFMPDELSGPPGLVGKPLYPSAGFAGETVWYDPLSGNPFVAKCSRPIVDMAGAQCVRTVHLGPEIAAVYSFGLEVLEKWRHFDTEINGKLEAIGAL